MNFRIFVISATIASTLFSCIPARQVEELQTKYDKCDSERNALNSEKRELETDNTELKSSFELLQKENASLEAITSYMDEHRWELGYPQTIFRHDEKSLLSFGNYAIEILRERMDVYDRLLTMQHKTGTVNPVVFVAVGTLIWLLS